MNLKRPKYSFGWIPDRPDQRDYTYSAIRPKITLPPSADLSQACSKVENQGHLGSCTANALAGNIEFLDKVIDDSYTDVSRLFIYYNERALEGNINYDAGATLRDGIKTLAKHGVCPEATWPYDIERFTVKPSAACYAQALKRRILSYHRLESLNDMLTCLADGFPFIFGFAVYESFATTQVAKTGIVPMPKKSERASGGHAVMGVGYNKKTKRILVRNSWGEGWGRKGYCTMPFEYIETLARDFWTIRK